MNPSVSQAMDRTLLVIPHYNDTRRLAPYLASLRSELPPHFSVLVSDDGSLPGERKKLLLLCKEFASADERHGASILPPYFTDHNTGKGGAILRGWENHGGYSLIAFADADGAVSARELVRAEQFLRSEGREIDVLFGSRVKMLGRSISRSFIRHLSGRIFATLVSIVGKVPAYDTQCGLKILRQNAYEKIRGELCSPGFAFDVELLLLLLRAGCSVVEFPVDWNDVSGSKVSLFRDSIRMTLEVFAIRKRLGRFPQTET